MVLEFPAIFGISTILLQRTGITGLRLRAILCDPPLRVERPKLEVLTGWTLPHIEVLMIGKPGCLVLTRSLVRMSSQPFEASRHSYQEKGVPRGQQHFSVDARHRDS